MDHPIAAEAAAGVSVGTARNWLARRRLGGEGRHHGRSSTPRRCPLRTEPDGWPRSKPSEVSG
ncbi:leucine zipper domain-containing protein [Brevundimonas sp.]|uniref:leucine zipper domain-containing protein n=1 Tax=Brevundimonas sp. TaxID=1871086 RepID=UPI0035249F08